LEKIVCEFCNKKGKLGAWDEINEGVGQLEDRSGRFKKKKQRVTIA